MPPGDAMQAVLSRATSTGDLSEAVVGLAHPQVPGAVWCLQHSLVAALAAPADSVLHQLQPLDRRTALGRCCMDCKVSLSNPPLVMVRGVLLLNSRRK